MHTLTVHGGGSAVNHNGQWVAGTLIQGHTHKCVSLWRRPRKCEQHNLRPAYAALPSLASSKHTRSSSYYYYYYYYCYYHHCHYYHYY